LASIFETNLPQVELVARGKVRDIYAAGDFLVIVATDRLSAFDYVLPTPIRDKGKVLTALTIFWLEQLRDIVPNHFVSASVSDYPPEFHGYRDQLEGRSMLVHRAKMIDVECVARGYVSGSGWKDYRRDGRICGIPLPAGLRESDQLPEPIFTPASKAQSGHDENITFEAVSQRIGESLALKLRDLTLAIYERAARYAATRGIIIADTKFELGLIDGELAICDEILTPDSSRFWPADAWAPGSAPPSYDKQPVRDWAESTGWDKESAPPPMPEQVAAATRERYLAAYERISGRSFDSWWGAPA
jgi:phosphoribosylaminoimidazole-succinocarboxamide synthase